MERMKGNGTGVILRMTEDKMKGLLDTVDVFSVEDMWVTSDVRPGRDEEKWLNMILRKK